MTNRTRLVTNINRLLARHGSGFAFRGHCWLLSLIPSAYCKVARVKRPSSSRFVFRVSCIVCCVGVIIVHRVHYCVRVYRVYRVYRMYRV